MWEFVQKTLQTVINPPKDRLDESLFGRSEESILSGLRTEHERDAFLSRLEALINKNTWPPKGGVFRFLNKNSIQSIEDFKADKVPVEVDFLETIKDGDLVVTKGMGTVGRLEQYLIIDPLMLQNKSAFDFSNASILYPGNVSELSFLEEKNFDINERRKEFNRACNEIASLPGHRVMVNSNIGKSKDYPRHAQVYDFRKNPNIKDRLESTQPWNLIHLEDLIVIEDFLDNLGIDYALSFVGNGYVAIYRYLAPKKIEDKIKLMLISPGVFESTTNLLNVKTKLFDKSDIKRVTEKCGIKIPSSSKELRRWIRSITKPVNYLSLLKMGFRNK